MPKDTKQVQHIETDQGIFRVKPDGTLEPLTYNGQPVKPKQGTANEEEKNTQAYLKEHNLEDNATNRGKAKKFFAEQGKVESPEAGVAALDRESTRLAKPHETAHANAAAQLEKIAEAEAMVQGNAESQALAIPKVLTALVSGQGTGVRITQPELNAIGKARGITGDVEGFLRSIAGKGKLTPEQRRQLVGILEDAKGRILQKQQIHSAALDKINGARSRDEIIQADKEARKAVDDLESGKTGQMIRARDPQGNLHEAPAGTKLPAGWKLEK
jgi:hypothetical protein